MTTTTSDTLPTHTAVPALAGYVYQIEQALLYLLDLPRGCAVGVEVMDDIHVECNGVVTSAIQVKYHMNRQADLTDGSSDLWKTLSIWASAVTNGSLNLLGVRKLLLFTTGWLPSGSVAEAMANRESAEKITEKLLAVPVSRDERLAKYFKAVHDLDRDQLANLVVRIAVVGAAPDLEQTRQQFRLHLRKAGYHDNSLDFAVSQFEGWIWNCLAEALAKRKGLLITEEQFHNVNCLVRDGLSADAPPARQHDAEFDEAELTGQEGALYVRQLDLIGASPRAKGRSIRDYFRATRERTGWLDRAEILPEQLGRYDRELVNRWQPDWDNMCDDVTDWEDEETLRDLGLEHFRRIEKVSVPIHPKWAYQYLTAGSYHALADRLRVGWHPMYRRLLGTGGRSDEGSE